MAQVNYEKYLIKKPAFEVGSGIKVKNQTSPSLVYMSNALIPEVKYNIEFGWVWGMPDPNPCSIEHVHAYDEIILNIGGDCRNPEDLGAEIKYAIGGQSLNINTTGALFVPKGVRHGPLIYQSFRKPHVHISLMLGTGERQQEPAGNDKISGKAAKPETNFEKYLVRKPAYEVIAGTPVKNRQDPSSMTMMSNNLVPGCNIYVEGGWVWGLPDPNPHIFEHVHDYEEIVIHFGTDYKKPAELGAEIEFCVGGQPLKVDKTSAVYVPRGIKHGPLTWKKYSSPHLEMAIMPGAGTLAEADPGGHQEKMNRRKQGNG
jgi:hypothetical protein